MKPPTNGELPHPIGPGWYEDILACGKGYDDVPSAYDPDSTNRTGVNLPCMLYHFHVEEAHDHVDW